MSDKTEKLKSAICFISSSAFAWQLFALSITFEYLVDVVNCGINSRCNEFNTTVARSTDLRFSIEVQSKFIKSKRYYKNVDLKIYKGGPLFFYLKG